MANKKYLKCTLNFDPVLVKNGRRSAYTYPPSYENPLKLSEAHLISKMASECKYITVELMEVTESQYNLIFK